MLPYIFRFKPSFILIALFLFQSSLGQEITGVVLDSITKNPIYGASVYFDGSTFGSISNEEGRFSIELPTHTQAPLIISHIGYKTVALKPRTMDRKLLVQLVEDVYKIPEIVLSSDPFTREEKLEVFRKEFLGDGRASESCLILNEDDIELYYNSNDSTLTAYSEAPLEIENAYLGYRIQFDLETFKIAFKGKSIKRLDNIRFTEIYGFAQYTDIANENIRILNRREELFLGSALHFMRTGWRGDWANEGFTFKKDGKWIAPNELLEIRLAQDLFFKELRFRFENFTIYFNRRNRYRSPVKLLDSHYTFTVDTFGAFKPYDKMLFGGYIASQRISQMLPIDYIQP